MSHPERTRARPRFFYSSDAKLLLQARGGRRVLEYQALVRVDVTMCLLGHQRPLVETAQDKLELARVRIDVADREDPGHAGLKSRRLDRHQIVLERDAPVRHRSELHGQ